MCSRTMTTQYFGEPASDTVLIQMVDSRELSGIEQEVSCIRQLAGTGDFLLAAVETGNWNNDLSPWPAPPVFGDKPFGGEAEQTFAYLTNVLLPDLSGQAGGKQRTCYIGGYSLAGLFALWTVSRTDLFAGAAAVSPSVWFPDFRTWLFSNPPKTQAVYLSLGDREEKTRNPVMAQVGDAIRDIYGYLEDRKIPCTLEWNPGNHFMEPEQRMAKGFAWLLRRLC